MRSLQFAPEVWEDFRYWLGADGTSTVGLLSSECPRPSMASVQSGRG